MRESCYTLAIKALKHDSAAYAALQKRFQDHPGWIIACDFDGTLCRSAWPDIGEANEWVIQALKLCMDLGARAILWTCREYSAKDAAVTWCALRGLYFTAVNENPQDIIDTFGLSSRKIYADEYWDDKAVIPEREA